VSKWLVAVSMEIDARDPFMSVESYHATRDAAILRAHYLDWRCGYSYIAVYTHSGHSNYRRPRYTIDRRDKSSWPICGLGGLINSLSADWF